jgi:hypothetical protein
MTTSEQLNQTHLVILKGVMQLGDLEGVDVLLTRGSGSTSRFEVRTYLWAAKLKLQTAQPSVLSDAILCNDLLRGASLFGDVIGQ